MLSVGWKLTKMNFTNVVTHKKFYPNNFNNISDASFRRTDRSSNMPAVLPRERHAKCSNYFSAKPVDVGTELLSTAGT
jgi:hypothetical protein